MTVRTITYPEYSAELFEGGDIRLRFNLPGSKFGPVEVVLVRDDAEGLLWQLDTAVAKSWALRETAS